MDLQDSGHVCHSFTRERISGAPHWYRSGTCYSVAVALLQVLVNNAIVLHRSKLEWMSVCVHVQTFPIPVSLKQLKKKI